MLTYTEPSRREGTPIPRSSDFARGTRASDVLDLVKLNPLWSLRVAGPRLLLAWLTGLSSSTIPISQVKMFARYPAESAARVLEPAASHACTERLSPGSCPRREAAPHRGAQPLVCLHRMALKITLQAQKQTQQENHMEPTTETSTEQPGSATGAPTPAPSGEDNRSAASLAPQQL
jgi:hypothetical protein